MLIRATEVVRAPRPRRYLRERRRPSYDNFIPVANGSPGTDAFDISNSTGTFSLPNAFPFTGSVAFTSASLTLTQINQSVTSILRGNGWFAIFAASAIKCNRPPVNPATAA